MEPSVIQKFGGLAPGAIAGAMLLVSHVLTELSPDQLSRLYGQAAEAGALLWVESATHGNSRRFVEEVRERLLATGQWRVIAPCSHSGACPLLAADGGRHWCHHFARVPSEVHQSGEWRELSKKLGVDLRVLPYTFVAMERINAGATSFPSGFSRVIGEAREFKGHLKVLSCGEDGLLEKVLQKRDAPALFKEVRSGEALPLYAWEEREGRIVGGRGQGTELGESRAD